MSEPMYAVEVTARERYVLQAALGSLMLYKPSAKQLEEITTIGRLLADAEAFDPEEDDDLICVALDERDSMIIASALGALSSLADNNQFPRDMIDGATTVEMRALADRVMDGDE